MIYNTHVRKVAKENGVWLWQIADSLGIAEATFIKRLRHELPADEQRQLIAIIESLAKEEKKNA